MANASTLAGKVKGAAMNDGPSTQSVSPADLQFLQKHTRGVIKSLKPRLASNAEKYVKSAPVCTVAPTISGTTTQTTTNGTWVFSPSITYSWTRDGAIISGATSVTYVLVAADSGRVIKSRVIATNVNGANAEPSSNQYLAP
jgi:hypothetical protein